MQIRRRRNRIRARHMEYAELTLNSPAGTSVEEQKIPAIPGYRFLHGK